MHRWVQASRECVSINGRIRILNGDVPLDVPNNNLSVGDGISQGFCNCYLDDAKSARWPSLAVFSDRTNMRIVYTHFAISEG